MKLRLWLIVGLAMAASAGVAAEPSHYRYSQPAVRQELIAVITEQLEAIRSEAWDEAFALATTPFRRQSSREAFAGMIRRNYPIIWRNTRAEFGLPQDDGRGARVTVQVWSQDGRMTYQYLLLREEGGWRIAGVLPVRNPESAGQL
jgi:hypothetical protein